MSKKVKGSEKAFVKLALSYDRFLKAGNIVPMCVKKKNSTTVSYRAHIHACRRRCHFFQSRKSRMHQALSRAPFIGLFFVYRNCTNYDGRLCHVFCASMGASHGFVVVPVLVRDARTINEHGKHAIDGSSTVCMNDCVI